MLQSRVSRLQVSPGQSFVPSDHAHQSFCISLVLLSKQSSFFTYLMYCNVCFRWRMSDYNPFTISSSKSRVRKFMGTSCTGCLNSALVEMVSDSEPILSCIMVHAGVELYNKHKSITSILSSYSIANLW